MYKIIKFSSISFLFIFFLTPLAKSQDITGRWVIKSVSRTDVNPIFNLYQMGAQNNPQDFSGVWVEMSSNGLYSTGTNDNPPLNGNWSLNGNVFSVDENTFEINWLNSNEFESSANLDIVGSSNAIESATITTTYIRESVLPVELSFFNVTKENIDVALTWSSATEENFSHYEVERSFDGTDFKKIGEVRALGSNSNYTYHDENIPLSSKIIYYRLKMVDEDGTFKYSAIKSIEGHGEQSISIFPNPTSDDRLQIEAYNTEITDFVIKDTKGMIISSRKLNPPSLDISTLNKGVYIITLLNGSIQIHSSKFVRL